MEEVRTDRLLKPSEVNGERALVLSGTESRHGDIGDGRNHHEC